MLQDTSMEVAKPSSLKALAKSVIKSNNLSWLSSRIERARREPFAEICEITPSVAERLLELNDENRNVRRGLVMQIASDISAGRWSLNGEAIIVSRDGKLNDGQHRLLAVIEAQTPIKTLVMFGVTRESRTTVDMGSARTSGDFLGMTGTKYPNETASVSNLLLGYASGQYGRKRTWVADRSVTATKQEVVHFYKSRARSIDRAVQRFAPCAFTKKTIGVTAVAAAYWIVSKKSELAEEFFAKLISGENLKRNDPVLVARMHMMVARDERLRAEHKLELILRYWNAWRRGESLSRRISRRGEHPEIEA